MIKQRDSKETFHDFERRLSKNNGTIKSFVGISKNVTKSAKWRQKECLYVFTPQKQIKTKVYDKGENGKFTPQSAYPTAERQRESLVSYA